MAKFQDFEVLESAAYRQRNDRRFCGTPASHRSENQLLANQSVFLASPEDSSYTFVLSDVPKTHVNSTSVKNKLYSHSPTDRQCSLSTYSTSEINQLYSSTTDRKPRNLPPKPGSRLHSDLPSSLDYSCGNSASPEQRKSQTLKHKTTLHHANLIELGSPPNSPVKSPTSNAQQYLQQHGAPGNFQI